MLEYQKSESTLRTFRTEKCSLCGEKGVIVYNGLKDLLFHVNGRWSFMKCSNSSCGMMWLYPMPEEIDIAKIYKRYYTHSEGKPKTFFASVRNMFENSILRERYGYLVFDFGKRIKIFDMLVGLLPFLGENVGGDIAYVEYLENGKMLDVGCGNGHYLNKMSCLGWEVQGVDPDEQAAGFAQARYGLQVTVGTVYDANFADDSFDVITLNHVIEHVHDYISLLVECKRILKPSGKLILTTPNVDSLGCRYYNEYWRGLEPPRHLHLFTQKALIACCKQVGLEILLSRTSPRAARGMWVVSKNLRSNGVYASDYITWPRRIEGGIFRVIESLLCKIGMNVGEENIIIVKK
ncbi:MAG: methyltransferase domain-containing protein [Geobacter sp.]|nr:methyltransferase domain-containing protein [Geobacter sp.]